MNSRMFTVDGERVRTWNPVVGCLHGCVYCYARRWARRQRKRCQLCYVFKPHFHEERLEKIPKSRLPVFVCDMADLFGDWVPKEWILRTLVAIRSHPDQTFLLLTKNPRRYFEFLDFIPDNALLGATIESNLHHPGISNAPSVYERIGWMSRLPAGFKTFVSIEPILKFTDRLAYCIEKIRPEFIYIGYDNYRNKLPEPSLEDTMHLIEELSRFTEVRVKTLRKACWEEDG